MFVYFTFGASVTLFIPSNLFHHKYNFGCTIIAPILLGNVDSLTHHGLAK